MGPGLRPLDAGLQQTCPLLLCEGARGPLTPFGRSGHSLPFSGFPEVVPLSQPAPPSPLVANFLCLLNFIHLLCLLLLLNFLHLHYFARTSSTCSTFPTFSSLKQKLVFVFFNPLALPTADRPSLPAAPGGRPNEAFVVTTVLLCSYWPATRTWRFRQPLPSSCNMTMALGTERAQKGSVGRKEQRQTPQLLSCDKHWHNKCDPQTARRG